MAEIIPNPDAGYLHLQMLPTREELIALLIYASELEHGLACAYLFAAHSLKNDASEGGLTDAQASIVRQWRRSLLQAASNSLLSLAQISNLLIAIGRAPHIIRLTFPLPGSTAPGCTELTLAPFSLLTLERLAAYEHLEATIAPPDQQASNAAKTPQQPADDDSHSSPELLSLKELYDAISRGFQHLPPEQLFVGSPKLQMGSHFLDTGEKASLIIVTDRASASSAIEVIVGVGAQASICETISAEYAKACQDASQTGQLFEPVRPVAKNPQTGQPLPGVSADDRTSIADPLTQRVADLFNAAYDTLLLLLLHVFTHPEETDADLAYRTQAILRLFSSVIRPLGDALTRMPAGSMSQPDLCAGSPFGEASSGNLLELAYQTSVRTLLDERLWQMALAATTLRVTPGVPSGEIQEAAAALQDLACQLAPADGPDGLAAKIAALKQIEADLGSFIQSSVNGPYLVTNAASLKTWLGESIQTLPQMALCRCGGSAMKPFCDGTHAYIDFTSQKDPARVADHRDTYVGTAITIFDNRGICAHSGFCTDRLSSAFHAGKEPFVTPSGARLDEIVRAVRSCPSGALSYAIGPVEAREQVDQTRSPNIEVSKDGPYRITGGIPLKDAQGNAEPRNEGVSLEHYSLCRCGHSQNKPFCSGMHWYVNFHDPVPDLDHDVTLFEWVGGLPALNGMTRIFYDKYIPQDPLLHPLFANMSPDHPERVAAWLGEVFKGPKSYSEKYGGYERMLSQHIGKGITEEKRARWASLLCQSADEAGVPADPEFRSAFTSYIEWGSRLAVENSTVGAHPPLHMPMPHWDWGTAGPPMSRVSALAPVATQEEQVALPAVSEEVHFTQHIKPLFRVMDRQSMKWGFDLWEYDDVVKHANAILQRLQNGSMPCDGAWPREKLEVFQRWIDSGMKA